MAAPRRKKLIEVGLPLVEISDAASYDKLPGIGPHPKSVHKWWAPLPLPAARAVLFASIVDDPSADPRFADKTEEAQARERERLFRIISSLVSKRTTDDPDVFAAAHEEMVRSSDGCLPIVADPFAGSGAIPLEALRLGLKAKGTDLNPIPVVINKVLLEILPKFAHRPPIHPDQNEVLQEGRTWECAKGIAEDLRFYGMRILARARSSIGHLYPQGIYGEDVIAWMWTRTVKCPNPACGAEMPLLSTFSLSTKKGRRAWIEPIVHGRNKTIEYKVRSGTGKPPKPPKVGRGAKFRCLVCGEVTPDDYIKDEGSAGRIGYRMTAMVTSSANGRVYREASQEHTRAANEAEPTWYPVGELANDPRNLWGKSYGLHEFADLYTPRQLTALTAFSDLVCGIGDEILQDANKKSDWPADSRPLCQGGTGSYAYRDALLTLLAFVVDRCADFNNSLCRWKPSGEQIIQLFSRQAIPMVWDFVEANILGEEAIGWYTACNIVADAVEAVLTGTERVGLASQASAEKISESSGKILVSTDPPYYDNISYANLSDFFYVWLRRNLRNVFPDLFGTMLVPKGDELIAEPERFGGKDGAEEHFESGFRRVFDGLRGKLDERFPMTIYYAFKQTDVDSGAGERERPPGWETLLEALISSGFEITGTWPITASQAWRQRAMGANALASYVVLVCRPRALDAPISSRRELISMLQSELPVAVRKMQLGDIAPVDLAQASIGPGMAVYSRYSKVLEPDGTRLRVRTALQLINRVLDEYLAEQEGYLDEASRFAVAWFEQYGFNSGDFGTADVLARAKNTSVDALAHEGVLRSGAGKVRLYKWDELNEKWDPEDHPTIWEATHRLVQALNTGGEAQMAAVLAQLSPELAAEARQLAYRLYTICERKSWTEPARDYNALVVSWGASQEQARGLREQYQQGTLPGIG